jgi:hypothetical protein
VHPEQDACSRFLGEEAIGRDLTSKEFNLKGCIIDDSQLWEEYVNSLDFQLSLNIRPFNNTLPCPHIPHGIHVEQIYSMWNPWIPHGFHMEYVSPHKSCTH